MFSAKAAALLAKLKKKVDWSKRDRDILSVIATGVKGWDRQQSLPFCAFQKLLQILELLKHGLTERQA
jgi:hypothetical protein